MMTMMKTTAALLLPLLLAACSAIPQAPEQPAIWDLGTPPALQSAAAPTGAPLALGTIRTTPTFDNDAILYRLLYAADGDMQPRPYAHSRWAAPVPQLLAQRLQQILSAHRPVLDAGNGRLATFELRLNLEEFAQHFASESESSGVIRLRATLMGGQPRHFIAQRTFQASAAAPTPDAPGGVQALRTATHVITNQIDAWLATLGSAPSAHQTQQ